MKRNLWTTQEESVIMEEINKSPLNYKVAFGEASKRINRTPGACMHHFYNVIKDKTPMVIVATSEKQYTNQRVTKRIEGVVVIEDAMAYVSALPVEFQKMIKKYLSFKLKQIKK